MDEIMTNDRLRKQAVRERMATTGERFSVAARHLNDTDQPVRDGWGAFADGFGITLDPKYSNQDYLPYWSRTLMRLVVADWAGDIEPLTKLGAAYKQLDDKGHYFCYNHYFTEFMLSWFTSADITLDRETLLRRYHDEKIVDRFYPGYGLSQSLRKTFGETPEQASEHLLDYTMRTIQHYLETDNEGAKNSDSSRSDGVSVLSLVWFDLSEEQKHGFVSQLTEMIVNLPSLEEANTDDILYNRYHAQPPAERVPMNVGDTVKFVGDGIVYTVRKETDHFTILTGVIPEGRKDAGRGMYTIIDWDHNMRGAHNSWGHSTHTMEGIEELAEALEKTVTLNNDNPQVHHSGVELGRNQTQLRIRKVVAGKPGSM
jgi:hypothetical protein